MFSSVEFDFINFTAKLVRLAAAVQTWPTLSQAANSLKNEEGHL